MTGFELFSLGILAGVIIALILIAIMALKDKDDKRDNTEQFNTDNSNNNDNNISNRMDRSVDRHNSCYKDRELTNLYTIIALKNIKREMSTMLSNMEKDAIDKAIKNTIKVENLYSFIELKNKENE